MREQIAINLFMVAVAATFFIGFWLVNLAFGIWQNVGILKGKFEPDRIRKSAIQTAVLAAGLALFCILITTYPHFLTYCGVAIPEEYIDLFSITAILLLFIYPTWVYLKDAYEKLQSILGGKE